MRGSLFWVVLLSVGCGTPVSNGGSPLLPVSGDVRDRVRTASARLCAQIAGLSCAVGGTRVSEAQCNDTYAALLDRQPACGDQFASFLECVSRLTITCDLLTSTTPPAACMAEVAQNQTCIRSVPRDAGRPDGG